MEIRDYKTEVKAIADRKELLRLGWTVSQIWYEFLPQYEGNWHLVTNRKGHRAG